MIDLAMMDRLVRALRPDACLVLLGDADQLPSIEAGAVFINDFLNHDVSGPFIGDGLSDLCSAKKWTPGLLLTCDAVPGGMADVKNGILTCIRVAIEIGG